MTQSHNIRREDDAGSGRYVLPLDATQVAEMTFVRRDGVMAITHTAVPPVYEGRGIGRLLVERAVEDARTGGYSIRPLCGYVAGQFRRTPEWADVLAPR